MLKLDFERPEYDRRIAAAQERMAEQGIDALFITTEGNVRYFTGYTSHRWLQPTSPEFAVIPRRGEPILILPTIEMDRASGHPWLHNIRESRRGTQFGADRLIEAFGEVGAATGRIGAELGSIFHLGMPHDTFVALGQAVPQAEFVDASALFWSLRSRKSTAEIRYMERALEISADAFDALRQATKPGMSERELHSVMVCEVMRRGADRPGSMPLGSRAPGEALRADSHLRLQTERKVQDGDVIWLDVGCVVNGYWSDTMRMYALGRPRPEWCDAYAFIWEAVDACATAAEPGTPANRPVEVFQERLKASPYRDFLDQRFQRGTVAHAIGVDLIEPPYMRTDDTSRIQPGMVFTIEPLIYTPEIGFFMLEEQVLITESGPKILSRRAPAELPEA